MENIRTPRFSVSDFLAVVNQTLDVGFGAVEVEGEVASFKTNHNKFVFFDIKDDSGSVGCFMMAWQLRFTLEDGMKVLIRATPKVTNWGKFSLTVQAVRPVGEGSIKRANELLKIKLEKEGLFSAERKRLLPKMPSFIGVISSTEAAGYKDFIKILNERWGGLRVDVAHVQVQGDASPSQIVKAIDHFNSYEVLPEVIVLIRGGGAADDLSAFNDELVVRAIASSRVPTLVGVGHEIDETLSDLASDVRASTPTHAAQIVVPSRQEVISSIESKVSRVLGNLSDRIKRISVDVDRSVEGSLGVLSRMFEQLKSRLDSSRQVINQIDPRTVLRRGYAIIRGSTGQRVDDFSKGDDIIIETEMYEINAEVTIVQSKVN